MWPRVVEAMLACWLAISPFVFQYAAEQQALWVNDFLCAFVIFTLAVLSFWHPLRRAHLGICGVALWLIGFGFLAFPLPAPPASQNYVVLGLLLLMFAIIPSESSRPPQPWRDVFLEELK